MLKKRIHRIDIKQIVIMYSGEVNPKIVKNIGKTKFNIYLALSKEQLVIQETMRCHVAEP